MSRTTFWIRGFVAGALLASLGSAAAAAEPQIRWLHPAGATASDATVVSADGSVVGGFYRNNQGNNRLFRWTEGTGMQDLGAVPPYSEFHGRGMSADGQTMVFHAHNYTTSTFTSYRWTAQAGLVATGTVGAPVQSIVAGISSDGSLIIGTNTSTAMGTWRPFRWSAAGGTQYFPGLVGTPHDLSADGSRAVGRSWDPITGVWRGVRWTISGATVSQMPLDFIPSRISADGQTAAGTRESSGPAFRWTQEEGSVPLNSGGGTFSGITGITADGSVIVGYNAGSPRAMIWDQVLGIRDLGNDLVNRYGLDLAGRTLYHALAISDDGHTMVGNGRGPDNHWQAWIVTIPEPAALSLLMLTLPLFRRTRARAVVT